MRSLDFSSLQAAILTLAGLAVVTLIGVGIRLLMMMTFQQRRERVNRQINERLRTLIAAYKVLGGSFTGDLGVDPTHLRNLRREGAQDTVEPVTDIVTSSDRSRRIRDAVEAALSDVLLLGNEHHVRLAERAARDLAAGRTIRTHELVVSLRDFIREALDLAPLPADLAIPPQGPARSVNAGRGKGDQKSEGGNAGGKGGGMGMAGLGGDVGRGLSSDEDHPGQDT
jgi:hypothetical protein